MQIERYTLKAGQDLTVFSFISEGVNGPIQKVVMFQPTTEPNLYNLAFGDRDTVTGDLNDLAISNNGDTEKVLATVVSALFIFFDRHPNAFVYATGSTASRTRLYRIGNTRFYKQVTDDIEIYGQIGNDFEVFSPGVDYQGFLAERKTD